MVDETPTVFGAWIQDESFGPRGQMEAFEDGFPDLINLVAQLEARLEQIRSGEIPEAVKRAGLFACLTYKETIAALALRACAKFQEKYA